MLTPGRYYPGSPIRHTITFTDESGAGVDPSTVTFKAYSPCGREYSFVYGTDDEVQKTTTGNYYAEITPEEAGDWLYRWQTTGTGTTYAEEGRFNVNHSPFYDRSPMDYA